MSETIFRYKYVPFNEGSLSILKDGTMKFTRPSEFNDPFDCDPNMDINDHIKYFREKKDLQKLAGDSLKLSPARRLERKKWMERRLEKGFQKGGFGQKLVDNIGICSLSRDPLNLLMWAHYAQNHTGFVVEFCIPLEARAYKTDKEILQWLVPLEVLYERERPVISPFDEKIVIMNKQFLVKGHNWAYEQEERVIDCIRGCGIHRFERNVVLKSVIAGMRMRDDDFLTLTNTVQSMNAELGVNVSIYRAEPLKGKFALSVPGRDDLSSNPARNQA